MGTFSSGAIKKARYSQHNHKMYLEHLLYHIVLLVDRNEELQVANNHFQQLAAIFLVLKSLDPLLDKLRSKFYS